MSLAGKKRRSKKVQKNKQVTNSSPENNPASPTKSSKKRDKKLQKPDHVHESKGQSKALRYLKLWYSNKKCKEDQSLEPWKFEKCRQIWLLQNCYSSVRVPPEDFKILLKYMSTINGRMRDGAIGEFCISSQGTVQLRKESCMYLTQIVNSCSFFGFIGIGWTKQNF